MSGAGAKARSAVIWNTAFNLFRDSLQFVTMLVLVRLLEREAYGEFGLVTSVMGFLAVFSANSFLAYLLQVRDDSELHLQHHFTATAAITVFVVVISNAVALALWWVPTYAVVAPVLHVMSISFLLEWPCEFRRRMLERDYDWKRLRLLHGLGLCVSSVLALSMAFGGAGVYALIVPGMVVTLPFVWDLFVIQGWRPDWSWSRDDYRPALQFGITRIGSGLAGTGRPLVEAGALTRVVGFAATGVFNRALGLQQMLCLKSATQLMYAIYPVLTRLNPDPTNRARVNALVLRAVAWYAMPVAVVFSVLAVPVVRTLYGHRWDDVIPLLPWAMWFGVAAALSHTASMLLLALRQQRLCLYADVLVLIGTVVALTLGLPLGSKTYLVGLLAVQIGVLGLLLSWLVKLEALTAGGLALALAPSPASAFTAVILCESVARSLSIRPSGPVSALLYGGVFGVVYVAALRLFFSSHLRELLGYLPLQRHISRALLLQNRT